jgi:hypothetical protein
MESEKESILEKEFIEQLTPFQKIAYTIAINNLESSFSLNKCIGFLEYKEKTIQHIAS